MVRAVVIDTTVDHVLFTQRRLAGNEILFVELGTGMLTRTARFGPAFVGGEGRRVKLGAVHAARVVLNTHPDIVEIEFGGVGGVKDLLTRVANAKGLGNGVGVAVVFEDHRSATSLNKFHDGVDFRRRIARTRSDRDEAIIVELGQGEGVTLNTCEHIGGVARILDIGEQQRAADQRASFDAHVLDVLSEG